MGRIKGRITQIRELSIEDEEVEKVIRFSGQELGRVDRTIFEIGCIEFDNSQYVILEKYPEQDSARYVGYLSFSLNSIEPKIQCVLVPKMK